ncbi:ciliogenesis-associated TTC17-interacting protein-like [Babylonia areolata]|uniref:ciliogenesis-associated TTC17-interacting protein-like n=1 Tax=Babylonia areolata TaxID=304850 RepID=UPI003FD6BAB3
MDAEDPEEGSNPGSNPQQGSEEESNPQPQPAEEPAEEPSEEPVAEPVADPEAEHVAESEAKPDAEPETDEAKPEAEAEEAKPEGEAEAEPEGEAEAEGGPETEGEAEGGRETKPEAEGEGEAVTKPEAEPKAEPKVEEVLPKANQQALDFLKSAVEEFNLKNLVSEDHLVTVSDRDKELGEYSVSMEVVRCKGQPCFLIHTNSSGVVEGVPCGTSINCDVAMDTFETLEQHHHEFVKLEQQPLDRKTTILKNPDGYSVTQVITRGKEVTTSTKTFSLDAMEGFISEGANILLHRIFVCRGQPIPEDLQFISLDSEDNLCTCVYHSLDERTQKVEEATLKVRGVERHVESRVDLPNTWQSYFTADGYLTNRVQVGSPVTMTLLKLPMRRPSDYMHSKPIFRKKDMDWEEDMQMFSAYLDRKKELKNSHDVFVRHHPEMRALLADFLQFLLICKPQDVLQFAASYFAPFSRTPKTTPSCYPASAVPSRFPAVRSNARIDELRAFTLERV